VSGIPRHIFLAIGFVEIVAILNLILNKGRKILIKMTNKEILISAAKRFLRVAGATLLSLLIGQLLEVIPSLNLSPEVQSLVTLVLIPTLTALDKALRAKGVY
jgi:hypothetical protein